jgi:hypothetical protein
MTERHRLPNQQQSAPAMAAAEMIERAATTSIATHRTMRHLVLDIRKHFAHAVEAYGKFNAARIKLGQDLLEARARVEAGEEGSGITWWQWFEKNFPQSRSTAERAMRIAADENPQAADEVVRARNAIANKAYRARQSVSRDVEPPSRSAPVSPDTEAPILTSGPQEVLPPDPGEEYLVDQIIELFKRLSRSAQVRCAVRQRKVMWGDV